MIKLIKKKIVISHKGKMLTWVTILILLIMFLAILFYRYSDDIYDFYKERNCLNSIIENKGLDIVNEVCYGKTYNYQQIINGYIVIYPLKKDFFGFEFLLYKKNIGLNFNSKILERQIFKETNIGIIPIKKLTNDLIIVVYK